MRREGGDPIKKEPDRTTHWTDGKNARLHSEDRGEVQPTTSIPCLIVGDYKLNRKFRHKTLLEISGEDKKNIEAQKVMNQIHDYMDMHHNRFGYVITDAKVIIFQRCHERYIPGEFEDFQGNEKVG